MKDVDVDSMFRLPYMPDLDELRANRAKDFHPHVETAPHTLELSGSYGDVEIKGVWATECSVCGSPFTEPPKERQFDQEYLGKFVE
jgi:hypothetical protein